MEATQMILAGTIVLLGVYGWVRNRHVDRISPESGYVLSHDEKGVSLMTPHGVEHRLTWENLTRVCVRITPNMPMMPNFYWILESNMPTKVIDSEQEKTDVCALVYPAGASGEAEVLSALIERCQGLDQRKLVQSLKLARQRSKADFVIWQK